MKKLITFAIAAYNSEKFLDKCLTAFLCKERQEEIEVLIVNDGSKDETENIGKKYEMQYPDIFRVISKENGGHGSTINTAAAQATGKYFKVIDADDWVETENLTAYLDALDKTEADVVLTHYKTIDISDGKIVNWKMFLEDYTKEYSLADVKADWKSMDRCLTFHGIAYRTDFYRECGTQLAEKVFYEDHQFATIPCCFAKTIKPVDLCLYVYRIGDVNQSVSDKNQYLRRSHTQTVIREMGSFYKNNSARMDENGQYYYTEKLGRLMMSYLVTTLQLAPSFREGRKEAKDFMAEMKKIVPTICESIAKRYKILQVMNYFHINHATYQKILNSKIYNKSRKNKEFE